MKTKNAFLAAVIIIIAMMTFGFSGNTFAQDKKLVVRIAKLEIDSSQLEAYKRALKIHAETAVRVEAGVLNLYAVYEKDNPYSRNRIRNIR